MIKKICSLILGLSILLPSVGVRAENADTVTAFPDLVSEECGNIIYVYQREPIKKITTLDVAEDVKKEACDKLADYEFILSDKKTPDKEMLKSFVIAALFDTNQGSVDLFLFEDDVIVRLNKGGEKLIYCEYSDSTLLEDMKKLLTPSIKQYEEKKRRGRKEGARGKSRRSYHRFPEDIFSEVFHIGV